MSARAAVIAVFALSACGPREPAPAIVQAPPATSPQEPKAASVPSSDLRATICGDREHCDLHRVRSAGVDARGQKLSVVTLDLGVESIVEGEPVPAADHDVDEQEREDTTSPLSPMTACHRLEYWLVTEGSGAPTLLATACNDGYGASGVGEDVLTVGDNSFKHTQSGGSSWRWSWTNTITLSPLALTSSSWSGSWTLAGNRQEGSWDWTRFEGKQSWWSPGCDDNGETVDAPETPFEYVLIPRVHLDDDYRATGFQAASLGACAVDIDGSGERGFVTFGKPGLRADASLRAVLSEHDELFVEVRDAHPSGASSRWVKDDHIEIFLAPERGDYMDHCLPKRAPPKQWGMRIADGKVFAGFESPNPSALVVTRAAGDAGSVRFKVQLPAGQKAITVAYSDGDGKKQRRVFATSAARRGAPETLGEPYDVKPTNAVCKVQNASLEPVMTRKPEPNQPFSDD